MGKLEMKSFWLFLGLTLITVTSCKHSGFDSLLKQYSSFKEKQLSRKAKNIIGGNSLQIIEEDDINESRKLMDQKEEESEVSNIEEQDTESKILVFIIF